MQPDDSSNLLSKACRNNSWSAWISCMLGFLAAAIEAEDGWWWYNPLGLPPEPKPTGWLCLWGAITTVKKNKRKIKEILPPPNARWCKMIKKCGSSSFVKTKEQQWQKNQPLRRNTAYSPFYTTICKVSPLLYLSLAKLRLNALDEEQVKQLVRAVNRLEMRETREQPPAGGLLANWLTSLAS